jgi:hypothetical protein
MTPETAMGYALPVEDNTSATAIATGRLRRAFPKHQSGGAHAPRPRTRGCRPWRRSSARQRRPRTHRPLLKLTEPRRLHFAQLGRHSSRGRNGSTRRTHLAAGKRGLAILGPPLPYERGSNPPATLGQGKSDPRTVALLNSAPSLAKRFDRGLTLDSLAAASDRPGGHLAAAGGFKKRNLPLPPCESSRQTAYFVAIAGFSSPSPTRST